jgi:hypothetical protein
MVTEGHPVAIAQHPIAMRAALLLLRWTPEAADIVPALCLVVVAMGATQATTRGRGRAVLILAPLPQRLWIEVFMTPVVGQERDTPLVISPVIVVSLSIGRVPQLDLPWQHGHGQGAAMAHARAALIRPGHIGGIAQRSFQRTVGMEIGGLEVHVATAPLFLAWVLGVDMRADPGFEVGGHFGAPGAQLTSGT